MKTAFLMLLASCLAGCKPTVSADASKMVGALGYHWWTFVVPKEPPGSRQLELELEYADGRTHEFGGGGEFPAGKLHILFRPQPLGTPGGAELCLLSESGGSHKTFIKDNPFKDGSEFVAPKGRVKSGDLLLRATPGATDIRMSSDPTLPLKSGQVGLRIHYR